jgi:hypothetical protein
MTTPNVEEAEVSEELDEEEFNFTEEESELFRTLITVGCISETVDVFGHQIVLRTLNVDEDLQVGLIIKTFNDSLAFQRAYKTLMVAAAVRSVDGVPLIQALSMLDETNANSVQLKFEKMKEYYPPVIDKLYTELTRIESRVIPLLSRLGKI